MSDTTEIPVFNLKNHVIVLTGASGHLGNAMSKSILFSGAELIIVGRQSKALENIRNDLPFNLKEHCYIYTSDILDYKNISLMGEYLMNNFDAIHGIVNNAYSGRVGKIPDIYPDDFISSCNYNLIAPFMIIKELLPLLIKGYKNSGNTSSVVNIASMYGTVSPDPSIYGNSRNNNPVHYGATKAGMIQMTRYFACNEYFPGVRYNCISPGPFPNTKIESNIPNFYENLAEKVPMKRIGMPDEVAWPVVFLLSNASSYINGANLPVDGGWTSW